MKTGSSFRCGVISGIFCLFDNLNIFRLDLDGDDEEVGDDDDELMAALLADLHEVAFYLVEGAAMNTDFLAFGLLDERFAQLADAIEVDLFDGL